MKLAWIFVLASAVFLGMQACSVPSIHPLYAPESLVQDSGLVGEWESAGQTLTRVKVADASGGRYSGHLTMHHQGELKAQVDLELALTQIGDDRYVDLYLAEHEREQLAARYGFLALPVHQFMLIRRDGDSLRVWTFDPDWMQRAVQHNAFSCDVLPMGGRDISVVTADTATLRSFLQKYGKDEGALSPPMSFKRVVTESAAPDAH